ncbi:MAG: hypothetical protein ACYCUM_12120, partial [Solirubrobacteraceae bacterium]
PPSKGHIHPRAPLRSRAHQEFDLQSPRRRLLTDLGLTDRLPSAELEDVRRTLDPAERRAWADLRAGRADRALAHYESRGRLHVSDHRDQAVERAVQRWAQLTRELPIREVTLISDASNVEIDRLNARAQHHRVARGELGEHELEIPGVHYGVRAGDHVALIDQHRSVDKARVENGTRGEVRAITRDGAAIIDFDGGHRRLLYGEDLGKLRLAYAQHVHRAQGATVDRALIVTGGWQTAKEPAYVQASRARHGADFFVNRDDLGSDGNDLQRVGRLAERMRDSRRQAPSLSLRPARLPQREYGHELYDTLAFGPLTPSMMAPSRAFSRLTARTPHERDRDRAGPER